MKIYLLKKEDLYAGCDCGECSCWSPTVYETVGVYDSEAKAKAAKYGIEKSYRDAGYRSLPYLEIESYEVE